MPKNFLALGRTRTQCMATPMQGELFTCNLASLGFLQDFWHYCESFLTVVTLQTWWWTTICPLTLALLRTIVTYGRPIIRVAYWSSKKLDSHRHSHIDERTQHLQHAGCGVGVESLFWRRLLLEEFKISLKFSLKYTIIMSHNKLESESESRKKPGLCVHGCMSVLKNPGFFS